MNFVTMPELSPQNKAICFLWGTSFSGSFMEGKLSKSAFYVAAEIIMKYYKYEEIYHQKLLN